MRQIATKEGVSSKSDGKGWQMGLLFEHLYMASEPTCTYLHKKFERLYLRTLRLKDVRKTCEETYELKQRIAKGSSLIEGDKWAHLVNNNQVKKLVYEKFQDKRSSQTVVDNSIMDIV